MSDLLDQVDNAVETKPEYSTWGCAWAEFFEAVWPKGSSACERFDPTIHNPADKFIRGEIVVTPITEMNARFSAEWKGNVTGWNNRDWAAVILPSIKALGISAREIPGRFVKITKRPNGKFYEKKKDGVKTGEKAELTDFLFVKIFESEAACVADYLETKAGTPGEASVDLFPDAVPAVAQAAANVAAPDSILLKFAQAMVKQAALQFPGDLAKITEHVGLQISKNPMLAGKYTMESPEIVEMLVAAVA